MLYMVSLIIIKKLTVLFFTLFAIAQYSGEQKVIEPVKSPMSVKIEAIPLKLE